jgi:hypothetical protein
MRHRVVRSFLVILSLAAWFALTNHCALSAIALPAESGSEMSRCPMHSTPKKTPAATTPCCKDLRATVAKTVAAIPIALRLIDSRDYASQIISEPARIAIQIEGVDTGPPGCLSFAESVLQESMPSHAPPLS